MKKTDKYYRIEKIVVNIGIGEGARDKALIEITGKELMAITGQKPSLRKAKQAISGFKIRKGDIVGVSVTLRGKRMKAFLEKLVRLVLPKIRDFQGVSLTGFDGQGNYSLGISEQIVFPEIDYAKVSKVRGLQITVVTNTRDDKEGLKLLRDLGMPFAKAPTKGGQAG